MIRGFIDFNSLDSGQPFAEASLDRGHTRPGFQLGNRRSRCTLLRTWTPGDRGARPAQDPGQFSPSASSRKAGRQPLLCCAILRKSSSNRFRVDSPFSGSIPARRQVGLASDRFNTNGFCYSREGSRFSFADRANAVPAPLHRELDQQAVFNYLYFHVISAPLTIFKNILRLEPGYRLLADGQGTNARPWWQARFEEPSDADFQSSASTFRDLIKTAVERDLNGAPVGAFRRHRQLNRGRHAEP